MRALPTINDIKEANAKAGRHFFSAGAMAFFNSRIESEVINGAYFITSEANYRLSDRRRFTVRKFNPHTAEIETVGPFFHFKTKQKALEYLGARTRGTVAAGNLKLAGGPR